MGLFMLWVALSPSLLPRTWWMTAVAVGVSVAFGYAVGDLIGRFAGWFSRRIGLAVHVNQRSASILRHTFYWLLVLLTLWALIVSVRQQRLISQLVGTPSGGYAGMAAGVVGGLVLFVLLVLLGRGLALVWRGMRLAARQVLPRVIAPIVATVLLLVGLVWVSEGVLYRRAMESALGQAAALNQQTPQGRVQPVEPERSGSPGSTQAWESLGRDGQAMVADGPRAADISMVIGAGAMEPIRLYAGKQDHEEIDEAVATVLAEMDRTDAWERAVLHVTTTTGTGYVQEWSVSALEYLTGGDVATVSMQYSFFSSALAYVTDRSTAPAAGRALFAAVEQRWLELPESERPMLLVSGESLGAYGGQGAFDSADDLLARVDGAVWTGTPRFTPLWTEFTSSRRLGSPEIAPVIDNGRHVRFVTRPQELAADFYGGPYLPWESPRVVYAQHASDPIVWWEPAMVWAQPDWMREHVGRDVSPDLSWAPWVSFWQIALDMPLSVSTPGGHGHHYHEEMVPIWAAVLGTDVSEDQMAAIQQAVSDGVRPR